MIQTNLSSKKGKKFVATKIKYKDSLIHSSTRNVKLSSFNLEISHHPLTLFYFYHFLKTFVKDFYSVLSPNSTSTIFSLPFLKYFRVILSPGLCLIISFPKLLS